jgi:UDP-N-acetylmuramoyl-L-alanyl-D-glutamate--2,6-diaminopimelate ligase
MIRTLKNTAHLVLAVLANIWYGFPSKKLKVIGVTGTDGKTTTTSLIYHILKTAGKRVSVVTTVAAEVGGKSYDTGFHVTTPNPFMYQKILRQSVEVGDEYFVTEVTSHGLDQNRVYGVAFDIGVVTNITHEHLDYHKTYENYVRAKAKLLLRSQDPFINRDDMSYDLLSQLLNSQSKSFKTYGQSEKSDITFSSKESWFTSVPQFQQYNMTVAYAACKKLGLSEKEITKGLQTFTPPPGRMDTVYDKQFKVIIDFAHTPNAIEKWLTELRSHLSKNGRIIHVFGAAAHRDVLKRPFMGKASGSYADIVLLTEEDYRTEDPNQICDQIAKGLKEKGLEKVSPESIGQEKKQYAYIIDRYDAIAKAVHIARPGDVITITGKGHEQSLCRGTVEHPWNDRKAVEEILKELGDEK